YLVGAVILAALRNRGFPVTSSMVDEAIARAKRVPLGSCGLWGACGAAIGAGVGFSVALRVDMMSGEKRAQALRLVAGVLEEISRLGGPRCCKASVALAIMAARRLLNEKHGVGFDESTLFRCPFAMKNPDCLKEGCPFYAGRGESS
ncbi:MAG: DUF5714 domain-containing protein, partial [Candidatus Bathyarchaeia archaeon]